MWASPPTPALQGGLGAPQASNVRAGRRRRPRAGAHAVDRLQDLVVEGLSLGHAMQHLHPVAPGGLDLDVARTDQPVTERTLDHRVLYAVERYRLGEPGDHTTFEDAPAVGEPV